VNEGARLAWYYTSMEKESQRAKEGRYVRLLTTSTLSSTHTNSQRAHAEQNQDNLLLRFRSLDLQRSSAIASGEEGEVGQMTYKRGNDGSRMPSQDGAVNVRTVLWWKLVS